LFFLLTGEKAVGEGVSANPGEPQSPREGGKQRKRLYHRDFAFRRRITKDEQAPFMARLGKVGKN